MLRRCSTSRSSGAALRGASWRHGCPEDPGRRVCLIEAGPDYGPLASGAWPDDLLDPRSFTSTHDWGTGGEDDRSLGARVIGGCSAHNACMAVAGTPGDYDEWGAEWSHAVVARYLERARETLGVRPANTPEPAPFHVAFLEAAAGAGLPLLDDPDDPSQPVGRASLPVNVVDGTLEHGIRLPRRGAKQAQPHDRGGHPRRQAGARRDARDGGDHGRGVADRRRPRRPDRRSVLHTGDPPAERDRACCRAVATRDPRPAALPVGDILLDHHGTGVRWEPTELLTHSTAEHLRRTGPLFGPHAFVKAASSGCTPGSWDVHLVSWTNAGSLPGTFEAERRRLPRQASLVRARRPPARATLSRFPRSSAASSAIPPTSRSSSRGSSSRARSPRCRRCARCSPRRKPREPSRSSPTSATTVRNYFHPAGTCGIGRVVDAHGRVLGIDGLVVADASIMPTIPRANTNLTTVAVAERLAETI